MDDVAYVLETPKLPFVSFPYEWPFPALKAAALLHLEILLAALEQSVTLSDASAYNVQFQGARPIFIDHLSFRRYENGEIWTGYRQFCEQFLNPLLMRALLGVSHNAWYRGTQEGISAHDLCRLLKCRHIFSWNVLVHVLIQSFLQKTGSSNNIELKKKQLPALPFASYQRMLQKLHHWISKLEPADSDKTTWRHYATNNSYSAGQAELKKRLVIEFASHVKPKLLWDLGCNTGEYSEAALNAGAEYVVGFDSDQGALEAAFVRAQEKNLAFLPLFMEMANPTPNQGWRERERDGLKARASTDGILGLALVHHLAITSNIPLEQIVDWIIDLAPAGVIEFVPKGDPMVQTLLRLREDIFPDYTESCFLTHLNRRAKIIKTEALSRHGRLLVWYERQAAN
jgi:ribosomal protein L11 methylase PrmA